MNAEWIYINLHYATSMKMLDVKDTLRALVHKGQERRRCDMKNNLAKMERKQPFFLWVDNKQMSCKEAFSFVIKNNV